MDKSLKKGLTVYLIFTACAAVLLTVFRVVLSFRWLQADVELYEQGTALPNVFHATLIVCGVVMMTSGFLTRGHKEVFIEQDNPGPCASYCATLSAFLILGYEFLKLFRMAGNHFSEIASLFGQSTGYSVPSAIFLLGMLICAIPAAVYFLLCGMGKTKNASAAAGLSMTPLLWTIFYVLHVYFDSSVAYNSPVKILRMTAVIAVMLALVQESRTAVGIPQPGLLFPLGLVGSFFGFVSSCGDLFLAAKRYITLTEGYFAAVSILAVSLFVYCRTCSCVIKKAPVESEGDTPAGETGEDVSTESNESEVKS